MLLRVGAAQRYPVHRIAAPVANIRAWNPLPIRGIIVRLRFGGRCRPADNLADRTTSLPRWRTRRNGMAAMAAEVVTGNGVLGPVGEGLEMVCAAFADRGFI